MNKWEKLKEMLLIKMRLHKNLNQKSKMKEIARIIDIMDFLEEQEKEHKAVDNTATAQAVQVNNTTIKL